MLTAIISNVVVAILGAIGGWLLKVLHIARQDAATDKQEQESVEPLKKAKTAEEIDKASDDALGGL